MVFVDGTNLKIACQEDYGIKLNIAKLKSLLIKGYHAHGFRYYTSSMPHNSRDYARLQKERAFFAEIARMHGVTLYKGVHVAYKRAIKGIQLSSGNLIEIEHEYHVEKRTDVKLAIDMVDLAHRQKLNETYDVAMLVSNDTDFVPAVEMARALGKQVLWCGLDKHTATSDLARACNGPRILTTAELQSCARTAS